MGYVSRPQKTPRRKIAPRKRGVRENVRFSRVRARLGFVWRVIRCVPVSVHVAVLLALAVGIAFAVNTVHWIMRKPSELLAPVSRILAKPPEETWKAYGPLFQLYSTERVPASLLAALAQVESSGNPAAHTYWRWNLKASDWFGLYRPASSSVGMYQMTDPAFQDARPYCIRNHKVVAGLAPESCFHDPVLARISPADSVELTAIYLDRMIAAAQEEARVAAGAADSPMEAREEAAALEPMAYFMAAAANERATAPIVPAISLPIAPKFICMIHFFHTTAARMKMRGMVGIRWRMPMLSGLCIL